MKKLMLSSIVLLPIMVLMILLISSNFVAVTSHVYVEAVEIVGEGPMILTMSDEQNKPSEKFEVNVLPMSATNTKLSYSVVDPKVATISETGVVTAVDFGRTYVTAQSLENTSISVTREVIVMDTKIHRIEVIEHAERLYVGQNSETKYKVIPDEAIDRQLEWKSSNDAICQVDISTGTLTARSSGKVTIEVWSTENPNARASFEVECCSPVNGIYLDDPSPVIQSGREAQLPEVKFSPADAKEKITYSSSSSLANIDENGKITFFGAGEVTFTAKVVDGLGNEREVSKTYTCTDGYFSALAFEQPAYEFDYDECVSAKLPIKLSTQPFGASKGLGTPTFSKEGVIEYRNGEFWIIGTSESDVVITITAETYDQKTLTATTRVRVLRDASEITAENDALFTQNKNYDLAGKFSVMPANHTNEVKFESLTDGVTMAGSIVNFSSFEGVALIKITAVKGSEVKAEKIITISRTVAAQNEQEISVSNSDAQLELDFDNAPNAVILFTSPAMHNEVSYEVTEGEGVVSVNNKGHITAIKGGRAVIKITANGEGQEEVVRNVSIYVNRSVKAVTYLKANGEEFGENFVTSQNSYDFILRIAPADATAGKQLDFGDIEVAAGVEKNGAMEYTCKVNFAGEGTFTFEPSLLYNGNSIKLDAFKIKTTFGKLTSFELDSEEKLQEGSKLYIKNIDDEGKSSVKVTVGKAFSPTDFDLSKTEQISVSANSEYLQAEVSSQDGEFYITLTGLKANAGGVPVSVTIAGKTIYLTVYIYQNAQTIEYPQGQIVSVTSRVVNLEEYVTFTPATHTNKVTFSSNGDVASVVGSTVTFNQYSTAVITITAEDCDGKTTVTGQITITRKMEGAKQIEITDESKETTFVELTYPKDAAAQTCQLNVITPAGYENVSYEISGDSVTRQDSVLTPVKGGVSVVTITATKDGSTWTKKVSVYVNREATSIEIVKNSGEELNNFRTSLGSVSFLVKVAPADAMLAREGYKTLQFRNTIATSSNSEVKADFMEFTCSANLAKGENNIIADIYLGGDFQDSASAMVYSTLGDIDELTLEGAADGDSFVIEDVVSGKNEMKFKIISETITPADFILTKDKINVSYEGSVSAVAQEDDGFYVAVTGVNPGKGKVTITIGTKKVTLNFDVYKNATAIEIAGEDSLMTNSAEYSITKSNYNVIASDSTNAIKFASLNAIASVEESGKVTFSGEGTAIIRIYAVDRNGEETGVEAYLTITYVNVKEQEQKLEISTLGDDISAEFDYADVKENGGIAMLLTPPSCYSSVNYQIVSGQEVAEINGSHLVIKQGGFVEIKATITGEDGFDKETKTQNIKIYINREVDSITFTKKDGSSLDSGFRTSLKSYEFVVNVAPADAMVGKRLDIAGVTVEEGVNQENVMVYNCKIDFASQSNTITANVYREEEIAETASVTINSTLGSVDKLDVLCGETELDNAFTLYIGETITFRINKTFTPEDFVLTEEMIRSGLKVSGSNNLSEPAIAEKADYFEVTFTANNETSGENDVKITFDIGNKTKIASIKILVPAEKIEVRVQSNGGDKVIESGKTYNSLSSYLMISATLTGPKGKQVSDNTFTIKFGETTLSGTSGNYIRVDLAGTKEYTFSSKDGKVSLTATISYITYVDSFGLNVSYNTTEGGSVSAKTIDNFKTAADFDVIISNDAMNAVSFGISISGELIGVVEALDFIKITDLADGWNVTFNGGTMTFVLTTKGTGYDHTIKITNGEQQINVHLLRIDIYDIYFDGYNMNKEVTAEGAVNEDIYGKGMQQVRVFAKHSFYGGKVVDYFEVPLAVIQNDRSPATMSLVHWTLTRFTRNNDEAEVPNVITTQYGYEIEANGVKYMIIDKDASGNTLENIEVWTIGPSGEKQTQVVGDGVFKTDTKFTFVDPYSKAGVMKIYFGNFEGLNEEDIINDNFGSFDTLNGEYKSTSGTGAYLRVTASDGREKSFSYNFNVVNDVDGQKLVNVVDAAGFLDATYGKYVVLHTNLYGIGEMANQDAVTLSSTNRDSYQTSLIYGNGYMVNYMALGNSDVNVGRIYNVTLKSMNDPATELKNISDNNINRNNYLWFCGTRMQYSIIEGCENGLFVRDANYVATVKNCIFRYTTNCAVQLSGGSNNSKIYLENIVVVDCWGGVENCGNNATDGGLRISGYFDVFNYRNKADLAQFLTAAGITTAEDLIVETLLTSAKNHGASIEQCNKTDYFNLVLWNSGANGADKEFYVDVNKSGNYTYNLYNGKGKYEIYNKWYVDYNDGVNSYKFVNATKPLLNTIKSIVKDMEVNICAYGFRDRKDLGIGCVLHNENGEVKYNSQHLTDFHFKRVYRNLDLVGLDWSKHSVPSAG